MPPPPQCPPLELGVFAPRSLIYESAHLVFSTMLPLEMVTIINNWLSETRNQDDEYSTNSMLEWPFEAGANKWKRVSFLGEASPTPTSLSCFPLNLRLDSSPHWSLSL